METTDQKVVIPIDYEENIQKIAEELARIHYAAHTNPMTFDAYRDTNIANMVQLATLTVQKMAAEVLSFFNCYGSELQLTSIDDVLMNRGLIPNTKMWTVQHLIEDRWFICKIRPWDGNDISWLEEVATCEKIPTLPDDAKYWESLENKKVYALVHYFTTNVDMRTKTKLSQPTALPPKGQF